jgi:hypothetical protein
MRKHPRAYPPEFRQKIIELARSGRRLDAAWFARETSSIPDKHSNS